MKNAWQGGGGGGGTTTPTRKETLKICILHKMIEMPNWFQIKFLITEIQLIWLLEYVRDAQQVRLPGQESLHAVFLLSGVHVLN